KCQAAKMGCMICKPPRSKSNIFVKLRPFPDPIPKANKDHYMPFCEIYGKNTSEKYRPSSLQKVNAFTLSSTTTAINGLGTNGMEEENLLKNFIKTIDYMCDTTFYRISDLTKINSSILNTDGDNNQAINIQYESPVEQYESPVKQYESPVEQYELPVEQNELHVKLDESSVEQQDVNDDKLSLKILFKHVFVNAKLTCLTLMEVPCFSSHLYSDVCFQCGNAEILSPTPASQQPYCSECHISVKTKKKRKER
ncbi:21478_t:CDS:2, partial [Gigaspora rosea]